MNAEFETRKWIEDKVGNVEWGDFESFLELREVLIKVDESIKWDISKLRKEVEIKYHYLLFLINKIKF